MGIIFNNGNNNNGSSAVTEIDTASVIHHMSIQRATEITASPLGDVNSI